MKIKRGQHVSVLGINGSGKTYGTRNVYLPLYEQVIVVDTEDADFEDFKVVSASRAVALARSKYSFHVRVRFTGSNTGLLSERDLKELNTLCVGLLKRPKDSSKGPADIPALAVDFDEITDFSNPSQIPDALQGLIRKGRKRGISVFTCTQRPQGLNKWFLSNSQHHVYYFLSDYDVSHIRDYAPWLADRMHEIPYESYRSLYQAPNGEVVLLAPATEYDWSERK